MNRQEMIDDIQTEESLEQAMYCELRLDDEDEASELDEEQRAVMWAIVQVVKYYNGMMPPKMSQMMDDITKDKPKMENWKEFYLKDAVMHFGFRGHEVFDEAVKDAFEDAYKIAKDNFGTERTVVDNVVYLNKPIRVMNKKKVAKTKKKSKKKAKIRKKTR